MINSLKNRFRFLYSTIREKSKSVGRDKLWPLVREAHLEQNSSCAACGSITKLQVHHIIPVHIDPSYELDSNNLITLCMEKDECHLNLGHLGSWKKCNINVEQDARKSLLAKKSLTKK
jgi:hypothetical protein